MPHAFNCAIFGFGNSFGYLFASFWTNQWIINPMDHERRGRNSCERWPPVKRSIDSADLPPHTIIVNTAIEHSASDLT
jgi:hypothetical protein